MGEILVHWIENKLGLDMPFFQDPKKFRKAVSNGYLIGEILRKFNVISDDQCVSLKKSLSNKSCIKNMQRLHRWLRVSGLNTPFHDLLAIVEEDPGAAMRFIYRIYLWLECPKSHILAGFKQLPNLKKQLWLTQDETMLGCPPATADDDAFPLEFKPWDTLAERNRQFALETGEIKYMDKPSKHIFFDIPLQPPILLNVRPVAVGSEEGAEDLYFDFCPAPSSIDGQARDLYDDWRGKDRSSLCSFTLQPSKVQERRQTVAAIMKGREVQESMEEMQKLNEAIRNNLESADAVASGRIYEDGRGDYEEYRRRLKTMKKKLGKEEELNKERCSYRKSLSSKIQTAIPCDLHSQLEQDILTRVSHLPEREKCLAEFVTLTHAQKQCFLDHMVFEQSQLAQLKFNDMQKQLAITQEQTLLRTTLDRKSEQLKAAVEYETLLAQQEAVFSKHKKVIEEIVLNLLDLVMKVATYREAVGNNPPEPLMDEWRATFHLMDSLQEQNRETEEHVDILEDLYVNEYIFRTGAWDLGLSSGVERRKEEEEENTILKKMVSYILENLYPPTPADAKLPPPQFASAIVLAGVHFIWKPSQVRKMLAEVTISHGKLQVLDATYIVQEAIKAYSNSIAGADEKARRGPVVYPDELEGEVQTLWVPTNRGKVLNEEQREVTEPFSNVPSRQIRRQRSRSINESDAEEKSGSERNSKKTSLRTSKTESHFARKRKSSEDAKRSRLMSSDPTSSRPRIKSERLKKATGAKREVDEAEDEVLTDTDFSVDGGGIFDGEDDDDEGNVITGKAVEAALSRRKEKNREKTMGEPGNRKENKSAKLSSTLDIIRASITEPMKANATAEEELEVLFGPGDEPDTWPEFVQLGKLALDNLLAGHGISDDISARIIVERMRHYPNNSIVVILNYPHALCQAISLEQAVKETNLPRPPCYHHADMLIQQYKELRTAEAGPLISLASAFPTNKVDHRSALFKYNMEREGPNAVQPFTSFLDALIIADVSLEGKIKHASTFNNFEEAREKIMEIPGKSVEERIGMLLHISFLHLKHFYSQRGIQYCIELGIDEEPYALFALPLHPLQPEKWREEARTIVRSVLAILQHAVCCEERGSTLE